MSQEISSRPEGLGAELRRLREEAGVSIDEIITETKVSRNIFESLESGCYQYLPEKVFCRNFLRQYARIIGVAEEPILETFSLAWEQHQLASGTFPGLVVEEPPRRMLRWWVWLPAVLGIVVIGFLVLITIQGSRGTQELPPDPRRSLIERPTPIRSLSTPTPFVPEYLPTPTQNTVDEGVVKAVVRVTEGKECWIHYRNRNGHTGQELLEGGTVRTLEFEGPMLLTIGNADAASIEMWGKEYTDLGRPGEVAHFELSPEGLQPLGRGRPAGVQ
ncbi:MAG: DUF4115 domain-containing protein [Thermoanaerobaculales bacterium]|nr:DUF4115 domain-containing protein [Thermoanaerobaculales bacterium]